MRRKSFLPLLGLFLAAIILPYLAAQLNSGRDSVFGGFLLNPLDGNSYLAKMQEGYQGAWQFTLPFTAEQGKGAFLFLFYLLLGNISRITGLSLIFTFHLARVLSAAYLAYALYGYCEWVFENNPKWARRAFALSLFGSGLGWALVAFGIVTSDLWVAEAFPFLSAFVNPHFCLGMGLLLQILPALTAPLSGWAAFRLAVLGLLLAVVMPFGVVVAGVVGVAWLSLEWLVAKKFHWQALLAAFSLAGLALIYQLWAAQSDALLSIWNAQNITPAPPIWDFILALSPALFLAIYEISLIGRKKVAWTSFLRLQVVWFVAGLVIIFFPYALQRRFMFAFFVPVSMLALEGLRQMVNGRPQQTQKRGYALVMILSLLTNGVVMLLVGFAVASQSPKVYLSQDEISAFAYIRNAAAADDVILCEPEVGNLIPSWTGRRVLYGHDFETVNAAAQKKLVNDLLGDKLSPEQSKALLDGRHVQYILVGPANRQVPGFLKSFTPAYKNETVSIYRWQ